MVNSWKWREQSGKMGTRKNSNCIFA